MRKFVLSTGFQLFDTRVRLCLPDTRSPGCFCRAEAGSLPCPPRPRPRSLGLTLRDFFAAHPKVKDGKEDVDINDADFPMGERPQEGLGHERNASPDDGWAGGRSQCTHAHIRLKRGKKRGGGEKKLPHSVE